MLMFANLKTAHTHWKKGGRGKFIQSRLSL